MFAVKAKSKECSIINTALSLLMKHLLTSQRQKASNFSAFHWSLHGRLVSNDQHFVKTRVVHLSKRAETSLISEADLITESDQTVRTVHSCNSRLLQYLQLTHCITSSGYLQIKVSHETLMRKIWKYPPNVIQNVRARMFKTNDIVT